VVDQLEEATVGSSQPILEACWLNVGISVKPILAVDPSVAALSAQLRTRLTRVQLRAIRQEQAHLDRLELFANMQNLWAYLQRGWISPLRLRAFVVQLALGRATVDVEDACRADSGS
jgi:hypothetical protein